MCLSPRQKELLERFSRGETYEEIAAGLGIKAITVNMHIQTARRKLGARNTTEAVAIAIRRGLI